ncbi:MAG: PA0069 family radical SAM protein [Alphaproteobacteria bacterium]|nr:PA0069 family radical SAM protein [Alphaproteobacteria bacterium]
MDDSLPDVARKGRGAVGNPTGRYEPDVRLATHDGWDIPDDGPPLRTTVTEETPRTAIAYNDSPDIPFDRSINPYRGCEHGCIYCYARPSHARFGLSPGLDFESRLFAKRDLVRVLEADLAKPGYAPRPIALGSNTDPYQPIERARQDTRAVLELLAACGHPFTIVTKSALVVRDLDVLAPMAKKNLCAVAVSVTTLDRDLARRMEPRAATPPRRLDAIRALSEAGVPTAAMAAPMIPFLNDWELERILEAATAAGATEAGYTLLRLPQELKDLFSQWLDTHEPGKSRHVLNLLRECQGRTLSDARFGARMRGKGHYADLLADRFDLACRRLNLNRAMRPALDCSRFRPPVPPGGQLPLF